MADDAVFCQACGHAVSSPAQGAVAPQAGSSGRVSPWWWLLPIFFAVLGGSISYVANRGQNWKMARWMLILGLIMTPVIFFLLLIFGAALVAAFSTPPVA